MTAIVHRTGRFLPLVLLPALVVAAWPFLRERQDFSLPDAQVSIWLEPVAQRSPEGWSLYGAWTLSADDPRLAGLSGLACPSFGDLDMVTDTGSAVQMRMPEPGVSSMQAFISDLGAIRDAEAIGYFGNATFIAEEIGHRLWVQRAGMAPLALPLPPRKGYSNWGVEALLEAGGETDYLVAFGELGDVAYRPAGESVEELTVEGAALRITGAARHRDGRGLVLMRRVGPLGFRNAVARAVVEEDRVRIGEAIRLPLPINANAEGICVEPREEGLTRLWVVTDDNGLGILSQRVVAWDVPAAAWPKTP